MNKSLDNSFIITSEEFLLIRNKSLNMRLGFAIMLKYFRINLKFPAFKKDIPNHLIKNISIQLELDVNLFNAYKLDDRLTFYHKNQIRKFYGFREVNNDDIKNIEMLFLEKNSIEMPFSNANIKEEIIEKFNELKIELPSESRANRMVNSIFDRLEKFLFTKIYSSLSQKNMNDIETILISSDKDVSFNFLN